jgi:hypothetical protein
VKKLGRTEGGAGKRWPDGLRQHYNRTVTDAAGVRGNRRRLGVRPCRGCPRKRGRSSLMGFSGMGIGEGRAPGRGGPHSPCQYACILFGTLRRSHPPSARSRGCGQRYRVEVGSNQARPGRSAVPGGQSRHSESMQHRHARSIQSGGPGRGRRRPGCAAGTAVPVHGPAPESAPPVVRHPGPWPWAGRLAGRAASVRVPWRALLPQNTGARVVGS